MNKLITLQLENEDGVLQATTCSRFAINFQGKELWVQQMDDQLFIGTDITEQDTEYTNLVLRPMATNLISLAIETEPMEESDDENCCQDEDNCNCNH